MTVHSAVALNGQPVVRLSDSKSGIWQGDGGLVRWRKNRRRSEKCGNEGKRRGAMARGRTKSRREENV